MDKAFIIPLHIFPIDVLVSIGQTDKELKAYISKYSISLCMEEIDVLFNIKPHVKGFTYTLSSGATIIRLVKKPKVSDDYGVVTHEIFHAVDNIMSCVGITLSETSSEVYAYTTQYLTTQIFKQF